MATTRLIFTQFAEMGGMLADYLPEGVWRGGAVFAWRHIRKVA